MGGAGAVAVVDHRRHRGRFAGAGRADDQDHAELFHHDVFGDRRQLQILHGWNIRLDEADDHRDRAALAKYIDAEAAQVGPADREIHLESSFVFFYLLLGHDLVGDFLDTGRDRKSTRLNSSHQIISYAV